MCVLDEIPTSCDGGIWEMVVLNLPRVDLAVIKVKIVPSMLVEITVLVAGTEPG